MIMNDNRNYKEFFDALVNAIDAGKDVKRSDEPFLLKCGFVVDGLEKYLMKVKELKYAQGDGVDTSPYMDLQND